MKEEGVGQARNDWDDEDEGLDGEHEAIVSRVASCDTVDGRDARAGAERGLLIAGEQYLLGERAAQGSDEHVEAIRKSGWFPYQREIGLSARLALKLDALFWTALWGSIWWQWMRILTNA